MDDTLCPHCGVDEYGGSHYHCARCGGICGMMGHLATVAGKFGYTCEEQDNDITRAMRGKHD